MSEADNTTLIEMTSEIVAAYVAKNHVQAAELPALITTVHASLAGMGAAPEPVKLTPVVSIKKSVTDDKLISLEDGKPYKSLKRHFGRLGSNVKVNSMRLTGETEAPLMPSRTFRQSSINLANQNELYQHYTVVVSRRRL